MYRPALYRSDDRPLLLELMRSYRFATLVTAVDGVPFATHLPFIVDDDALIGHVARANPHWRHFDERPSLVVFAGPHAYVSPRWYRAPAEHVPTWNYAAVHVYGVPELLDSEASIRALDRLVEQEEAGAPHPWIADAAVRDRRAPAIVAFRIPLERVEGKLKLSQNREPEDAARVIAALTEEAPEVAAWMRRVHDPSGRAS